MLEDWITTITHLTVGESSYKVSFEWDKEMGVPGAFLVQNHLHSEFYLKTLTLEDVPGHGQLHFVCNSWVYPAKHYRMDRVFFTNKAYLPSETPEFLYLYRDSELEILRGDGTGMLEEWDRVYDYAFYNDLGDPDKDVDDARPVLEGSSEYPYPRRGRTGRTPTKSDDKSAWRTDEEFAKEMLAGVNPIKICLLKDDGTLKPLAIELSLPHIKGDNLGAVSNVYTPAENGVEGAIWQLAKAYVAVNDSGIHQLISHWMSTHAVVKPFVIAANRQLSVLHPIYKLLFPHFRGTMNINALARQILINGGGILEKTVFPGKYSLELSSVLYKDWVFPDQALPVDLVKRGMAVEDSNSRHVLSLLIEDYPYAVDGLEIWSAIKSWVEDYCKFYYTNDDMIKTDRELQSWWKELREEGHGDKKHEAWWPEMNSCQELVNICTTFIWIASALHAAVNYGQYPYAGYFPNCPTISRRLMPEPNTPEYDELKDNPDKVFLRTITPQLQSLLGIALIELLSRHSSDEVYLGQRECPEWTLDAEPLKTFEKFGRKLKEIEERIVAMNNDERLKNRVGPAKVPYTLLYPTSEDGKGIPNSTAM
ncbi:hypothetical protein L1987_85656 [Smallanthus sonchifolius]|uniref:Uncharacterized protein n=1 Tax=Smallanthus sonchifolius TaxID=185202 RepID=A0ACB8XYD1_9ASTR|nr:hypothetical protein L1987_85656 [Smallanthus sonchifolius]